MLFTTEQRAALESYIRGGGGFVGIHYTAWSPDQTEHDVNPFYRRLVGAAATGHPEPAGGQRGTVSVSDATHPLTAGLQSPLSYTDEWYEWDVNPSQDVHTLVTVDESSYPGGTEPGEEGTTHPVTWCQSIDQGRSWYSSLGHHASAYTAADDGGNAGDNQADDFVRAQLRKGLAYSAALLPADCSPPAKDEQGSWSGVTPWPLVPINAALTSDGKVQSFGSVVLGLHRPQPLRLERQRLRDPGRPDGDRRLGPEGDAHGGQRGLRRHPQRDLHRPVLLHAGADAAPPLDHDGRR